MRFDIESKETEEISTIENATFLGSRHSSLLRVNSLAVSVDGELLGLGMNDGMVYWISLMDGQIVYSWRAHEADITDMKLSQDGTLLATSGEDGFIRIWGVIP